MERMSRLADTGAPDQIDYLDAEGTQMAKSNGDLVAKAVRMARDAGREPATVAEARALLSLDAPW